MLSGWSYRASQGGSGLGASDRGGFISHSPQAASPVLTNNAKVRVFSTGGSGAARNRRSLFKNLDNIAGAWLTGWVQTIDYAQDVNILF